MRRIAATAPLAVMLSLTAIIVHGLRLGARRRAGDGATAPPRDRRRRRRRHAPPRTASTARAPSACCASRCAATAGARPAPRRCAASPCGCARSCRAGASSPCRAIARLRNVVGTVPGRAPAILVAAHYDVEAAPRGFVGANDGAAGTAAVVTLARAFARAPRPPGARELRFVLFDGEEEPAGCEPFIACGLRGSTAYAERHADRIGQMILLDYIAEKRGLRIAREAGSDAALWARLRRAAREAGVGSLFPPADAPVQILDDHTPFTQRGVPAIDVIDFDYPQRDSLDDTLAAVSERSLDAVGEAVHRLVARLRSARTLPNGILDLLHERVELRQQRPAARGELLDRRPAGARGGDLAAEAGERELQPLDLEVALGGVGHRGGAHGELADERDELGVVELVEAVGR